MRCDAFVERLYDDDVRLAQESGAPPPVDLAQHLECCASCRSEWHDASGDLVVITSALKENPGPAVRRSLLAAAEQRARTPNADLDWMGLLSCAGVGFAMGGLLASWFSVDLMCGFGAMLLSSGVGAGALIHVVSVEIPGNLKLTSSS